MGTNSTGDGTTTEHGAVHDAEPGVALVTGASRGLGFLLARELGRRGHHLVVCARSESGITEAATDLRRTGATVRAVSVDVTDAAAIQGLVAETLAEFGRLDVLIANAGMIEVGPVEQMGSAEITAAMDTMFWGSVHPVLAALPSMRERGAGRIGVISSIGGRLPGPHLLPYTTAKFAVTGFAEALQVELAGQGLSVTTVIPGLMRTGSPDNALFTGERAAEHKWFTVADSLPLLSIDAEVAARRIVTAVLRGRTQVTLTPAAKLGALAHGVAPGLVNRGAGLVTRLLPNDGNGGPATPGHVLAAHQPRWLAAATALTRAAADRWHQHDDPVPPPRT